VELIQLSAAALRALAEGDLAAATRAASLPLTPYLVSGGSLWTWRRRSRQVALDPGSASWVTGVIVDAQRQLVVGRAGFHGPPDADGMVEVGYSVDPAFRRQGYARAALVAMLDRAASEPTVLTVRATVSPDNIASRSLVAQFGFVEVGEQLDEEDGWETIFEWPVPKGTWTAT